MKAKPSYFANRYSFFFIILIVFITLALSGLYYLSNYSYQSELNQKIESAEYKLNQLNAIYINLLKAVRDNRGYRIHQKPQLEEEYERYGDRTVQLLHEYDLVDGHNEDSIIFSEFAQLVHLRIQNLDSLLLKSEIESKVVQQYAAYTDFLVNQIETTYQDLFNYWSTVSLDASAKFKANKDKNDLIFVLWLGLTTLLSLFLIGIYRISIRYRISEAQAQSLLSIIKQNELEFASAFDYASIGMALVSTEGKCLKVNKSLCDLLGYEEGELLSKTFQDITHPDDLEKDLMYVQQMLRGEIETYQMEKRYFTKSGELVWVLLSVSLVWENREPKHFISQIQDITKNKHFQDLIQIEKDRLQQIIKGTDAGTWEWNVQTGEVLFNEKWANLIGYTLKELEPITIETWMKFTHPEDLEESNRRLQECFEQKQSQYECACRMKHKDGHWVWIMDRGKVFNWTEDGLPELMFGSHIDISGMKELEEKLSLERQKFYSIFNSTFQFIGFLDLDGTLLEANQTALEFAGLVPEDVIGKKFWDCYWWQISTDSQHHLKQAIETSVMGQEVKYEVAVWDKDKNPVTILFNLKPLKDQQGHVVAVIPEGTPIQDIVDARTALVKTNQELEDFAYVASHDLKAPIRNIKSLLEIIRKKGDQLDKEKIQKYFEVIVSASNHMNMMIDNLLEYSRTGTSNEKLEVVNLRVFFNEAIGIFQNDLKDISHTINFNLSVEEIAVYPILFKRLINNILGNTIKYRGDGKLMVSIENKVVANEVQFEVSDNGIGIPEDQFENIFKMFKSLKPDKNSNGIGLPVCKKIVELHGGRMWVASTPGLGSTFYFTISNK
ncbi:PAS domain S-box protein [Cyclobacterium roseum]|uniref:PAS domain S-box protein n=1 Tax=Cyclobacterium roseum TaxID=2666137 RepID=UPI001390E1FF|nr:PAS domain S-box protein [Cyclobacterium roseum]